MSPRPGLTSRRIAPILVVQGILHVKMHGGGVAEIHPAFFWLYFLLGGSFSEIPHGIAEFCVPAEIDPGSKDSFSSILGPFSLLGLSLVFSILAAESRHRGKGTHVGRP